MAGNAETVNLVQRQNYQFDMAFGGNAPNWLADEPPLGQGTGPSPVQLLASDLQHLEPVLSRFEDFCTVTQNVGAAIPITVQVFDAGGTQLK